MTDADRLRQSLFITGIHRSGTSWVGRILAASKDFVIKDEEIFNPTDAGFPTFWYQYICKDMLDPDRAAQRRGGRTPFTGYRTAR